MSGHSVRGSRGFVAKEGSAFDLRFTLRLHADEAQQIERYKRPEESRTDYVRAALREKLMRDAGLTS